MSQDYTKPEFKKLLQKLQEESWQLELLISGFAIFGLFTAFEPIRTSMYEAKNTGEIYRFVVSFVALISCSILIFNLLLHVLLRGLWIGALGLRYVSGDINFDNLNYSQKFTKYLKKKVGSFDKYIATLENYCSVIFAISFLLIFYVLALTFIMIAIALIGNYIIDSETLPTWITKGVGVVLISFLIFGMFITFIDFATLGYLKKKKWISKIYFPIYWVFSFITLSFLYRPLVYNFLDNKFGRRLSMILVPFYFLIVITSSFKYNYSNYLNTTSSSNDIISNSRNYEDLLTDDNEFIQDVVIQSKVITDPYVKVFVKFSERIENIVFDFNNGLKPEIDRRGLRSDIKINGGRIETRNIDSLKREYLKTFNYIYSVDVDSLNLESEFILAKGKKDEFGFETYVGIKQLTEGKHLLKVNRLRIIKGDTTKRLVSQIPFWYYKD